jgi:hypothetical protein
MALYNLNAVADALRDAAATVQEAHDALLAEPDDWPEPKPSTGIWGLTMTYSTANPSLCMFNVGRMVDAERTEAWLRRSITDPAWSTNKQVATAARLGIDTMQYEFIGYFDSREEAISRGVQLQSEHNRA